MTTLKCSFLLYLGVLALLWFQADADSVCTLYGDPHLSKWDDPTPQDWEKAPGATKLAQFCGNKVEVLTNACAYAGVQVACTNTTTVAGGCNTNQRVAVQGDVVLYEDVGTTNPTTKFTPAVGVPMVINQCLTIVRNAPSDYTFIMPEGTVHVTAWTIPPSLGGPAGPYENILVDVTDNTCDLSGACGSASGPNVPPTNAATSPPTPEQHWASWQVTSFCDSIYPWQTKSDYNKANAVNTSIVYPSSPVTTTDPALNAKAQAACAALQTTSSLATQCGPTIDASSFLQSCLDDVILTGLANFAADSVNAFATQCVSRSPTKIILPTSGAYSTASGIGLGTNIPLYSTVQFTIYSRDIQSNLVTTGGDVYVVSVSAGPSTSVTFNIVDNSDGTYTVTYTATIAGTYTIEVRLNGLDSIRGSAFTVTWVNGACANLLFDGLAATIGNVAPYTLRLTPLTINNVNQQWKFVNNYIYSCNTSKATYVFDVSNQKTTDNTPVDAYIQKTSGDLNNQRWTYNTTTKDFVSWSAAGFYLKHVTSGGIDSLVCSYAYPPKAVVIQPAVVVATTSASNTIASGPGLGTNVQYGAQTFTIYARDMLGNARTTGGDIFTIISSPALSFTVTDNGDGTYGVSYTAAVGTYQIQVKYAGSQISGSPYTVTYTSPATTDGSHTLSYGPGLAPTITAGIPLNFYIQARTSAGTNRTTGGDVFVVSFNPPLDGETPTGPIDNNNGSYTVTYEQDDEIQFSISIKYGGVDVPGSPFTIQAQF